MQQIIALGGGGFSMEPDNLLLDRYILAQTGKPHPRVCFLPTASGDSLDYVVKFNAAFTTLDCQPSHLMLVNPSTNDLESFIMAKDAIYVGGGNTKSMLALWREWDMPRILRQAWQNGILLCGISAGANCWFEQCITDSIPGHLTVLECLGFLSGSCSPHYDGEPGRRPAYHRLIREAKIAPGYGVEDGAALHFVDESLAHVVSSRPAAKAYRLQLAGGEVVETQLPARYLG
ncbi:MAG: peptidase E [Chloroflexi bacterium]|nr:peptidase E [Chloroflexota bacterium]MCL5275763.1 peptidase E [Chloroflexota bacterium]